MIGNAMTRLGSSSRVLLGTCAYVVVAVSVVTAAFVATMALTHGKSASAATVQASVGKIGPGYGRMQPLDLGKPDKVAYATPHYPHGAAPAVLRARQPGPIARPSPLPPTMVAEAAQSRSPDVHRVY
jgi:hypothetical protein